MTAVVAGADGCRGGWLCVLRQVDPPFNERAFVAETIARVLIGSSAPAVIAIDIPIGFPERIVGPGRECDAAARKGLGKRASGIFSAPARAALAKTDYPSACAAARAASEPPRAISKQMFSLFEKILEVDGLMTPGLQSRVFECHPEAAFFAMNGQQPVLEPKKQQRGREKRRALLLAQGFSGGFLRATKFRAADADGCDFLDACACAWTAARILRGEAIRFPNAPPIDAKGLRMEILA